MVIIILAAALPQAAPAAGTWSETGPPATRRYLHTATPLTDGRVLVAGGYDEGGYILASAELYDPTTGTWSTTNSLATARAVHTATLLLDGRVLVAGGNAGGGSNLASAELYDPTTGTWSAINSLNFPRFEHTATLLADGRVLVIGGRDFPNSAELFDPANGTWNWSYAPGCYAHTATRLADGQVLVVGGYAYVGGPLNYLARLYNTATGTWSTSNNYHFPRAYHTATLLKDGWVLVAGGWGATGPGATGPLNTAELFDPALVWWYATGAMKTERFRHTATLLKDGRVLVAGGNAGGGNNLASAELDDPATGSWSATSSLAYERFEHTATLLPNERVLVAGGESGVNLPVIMASAELYDPLNLVANGSFETANVDPGGGLITLPAGSGDIAHWTVLGAGIDYTGGYWQPAEGRRSLDLNALDAGAIWQTIETSPGARYLVTFAMAGNPDGGPAVKSLRVLILGGKFQDFSFDTTGKFRTDMGWTTKSCTFTAGTGGTTGLVFQSLTSGAYGPALDNVRVIRAKPVPPLLLLLD